MDRTELEKAVYDIMSSDMALLQEYDKVNIIRAIMFADDQTLIDYLKEAN